MCIIYIYIYPVRGYTLEDFRTKIPNPKNGSHMTPGPLRPILGLTRRARSQPRRREPPPIAPNGHPKILENILTRLPIIKLSQCDSNWHFSTFTFPVSRFQCSVYCFYFAVCSFQFTVGSVQITVYSLQLTVYSLQFTVHRLQFTIHILRFTVKSVQFTVSSFQCPVSRVQFTVHSSQFTTYS